MRTIHTFMIRLMVDSEYPHALRGVIQSVTRRMKPQPFEGESALVTMLYTLCAGGAVPDAADLERNPKKDAKGER